MTLASVAAELQIPLRFLVAIRAVESRGDARAMRFEPHVFMRRRPQSVFMIARDTPYELAHPLRVGAWASGKIPYTPGRDHAGQPHAASSSSEETDRAAFERARAIDPSDAVLSSSWGTYQELGGEFDEVLPQHRLLVTDADAELAIAAFDADPATVSERMLVGWFHDNPRALQAAREQNVQRFNELYNGCKGDGCRGRCDRFQRALDAFDHAARADREDEPTRPVGVPQGPPTPLGPSRIGPPQSTPPSAPNPRPPRRS